MKILGTDFKLSIVDEMECAEDVGDCSFGNHEIRIRRGINDGLEKYVLIHEAVEALNMKLELGFEHNTITAISTGITAVLLDNGVDISPLMSELRREAF